MAIPAPERFAAVIAAMEAEGRLSQTDREMLICHYNYPGHVLTGRKMSSLMGWGGTVAHAHYGKLAQRIAGELDWVPKESEGGDGFHVSGLVLGGRANGDFVWTMRPQVVRALELLDWPELVSSIGRRHSGADGSIIERAAYVWQQSLERDSRAAKLAKAQHGYQCQACDMTFSGVYGLIGTDYIEAHHLVPLADIELGAERTYKTDDFAVLCSNCHRMIHRWPDPLEPKPWDLDGFRRMLCIRLDKS